MVLFLGNGISQRIRSDDLLYMDEIPLELYSDPVLSQFKCQISQKIVRFPYQIKKSKESAPILVDRKALINGGVHFSHLLEYYHDGEVDDHSLAIIDHRLEMISKTLIRRKVTHCAAEETDHALTEGWQTKTAMTTMAIFECLCGYRDQTYRKATALRNFEMDGIIGKIFTTATACATSLIGMFIEASLVAGYGIYSIVHKKILKQSDDALHKLFRLKIGKNLGGSLIYHSSKE
jgi:hypothetical protein